MALGAALVASTARGSGGSGGFDVGEVGRWRSGKTAAKWGEGFGGEVVDQGGGEENRGGVK